MGAGVGGATPAFPAPGATNTTESSQPASTPGTQPQQPPGVPANPFASLFGGAQPPSLASILNPATNPAGSPPPADPQNPFNINPNSLQNLLAALGGPPPAAGGGNPFAGLLSTQQQQAPVDNRPPEERYAEQLRQLNDMGFFDFEQNIAALRRSGGSVQGAVNQLLGG